MKIKANNKTERFIDLLQELLQQVHAHGNLKIHQQINETFYMQKIEEFRFLLEQLRKAEEHFMTIQERIDKHYQGTYPVWKSDARWLNSHLRNAVQSKGETVL